MSTLSRRHMLGTAAALLAAGLTACGGDSGSNDDASQPRTTLLVYLLGSNLESEDSAGTLNLMEMLSAQGSPHTRIVITTGGADKVDPKGLVSSWKTVKRFELADGRLKELADLGAHNMNEGGTLQDFVTWAIRTYPAERTLLMMWDHGSGYEGFGGDENFPDGPRSMSIPALAAALQGAQAATGVKLDYLGFDACLMATVEVAKILQPCARYLGASQELEPGSGWDWKAVIETASRQPAPSLPEFGQVVATAFRDKQLRALPPGSIAPTLLDASTFSIIDMARIPALLERLDQWARAVHAYYDSGAPLAKADVASLALVSNTTFWAPQFQPHRPQTKTFATTTATPSKTTIERWKQVAMTRLRTMAFGARPDIKDELDLIDLRQFAALLAADGIAATAQAALDQALQDAIVFNATGPQAQSAHGLSIFFPMRPPSAEHRSVYQPFAMPAGYLELIERHTQQAQQAPSAIHVTPLQMRSSSILMGEVVSQYGVQLADLMQVQPVNANVVKVTGSTPLISAIHSDIGQGNGQVYYDLQTWLQLGGQPLLLFTLSHLVNANGELDAVLLGAPVRLQSRQDGSAARIVLLMLRCEPNPATGALEGDIIGARDIDFADTDAPPDRVDRDLYEGDIVEPIHMLYDVVQQAPVQEPDGGLAIAFGPPVTMQLDSALRPEPLAAGSHTLILSVTDLADGKGFSEPLNVSLS